MECQKCGIRETPQWRRGPDGPGTLCNVCGLVFAKRQQRRLGRETASGWTSLNSISQRYNKD